MPYVEVWVDGPDSLDDFSNEDLIAELEKRGLSYQEVNFRERMEEVYHLLRMNEETRALSVMREFSRDALGRAH